MNVLMATSQSKRTQRKPRSLFPFLRWAGGLRPHPDLQAIFDGHCRGIVRKYGMSLDRAREACIEAGFLQDHEEREHEPTINDLLELIDAEARGFKQYRVHEWIDVTEQKTDQPTLPAATEVKNWMRANPRLAATMLLELKSPTAWRMIRFCFRNSLEYRKRERAQWQLFRRYVAAGAPFYTQFAQIVRLPVATIRADLQIFAYRIIRGEIACSADMRTVAKTVVEKCERRSQQRRTAS